MAQPCVRIVRLALAVMFGITSPVVASVVSAAAPAERQPNMVIILADDFGYGSTNATGAPDSLVKTPNLNRLAQEGKRFVNAYTASSVCSPTRYALLTGRYSFRTSLQRGVLNTFAPLHIGTDQLNIASLVKKRGYSTAAIGKWHLGYGNGRSADARTDYKARLSPGPLEIGFDYHFGVPSNHGDLTGVFVKNHYVYGLRQGQIAEGERVDGPEADDSDFQATYDAQQTEAKRLAGIEIDAPRRKNSRVMSVLTKKTVSWIEKQSQDKPFLLFYTPVAVHNPVTPDESLKGSSAAGVYGEWIHELDRSVGAVLDALDRQGFSDNTLVIFASDNGGVFRPFNKELVQTKAYEAGLKVNGELRGGKHTIYEGGFRVPYFVRWPGKVKAGSISKEIIGLTDTLATIATILGEPLPEVRTAAQDSYNILPAFLEDTPSASVRRDVIVHSADGVYAIRKGPWKWIEGVAASNSAPNADSQNRKDNFEPQLYNLESDPGETKNVLADHPQVAAELKSLLERYRLAGYSREVPSDAEVQALLAATEAKNKPKPIPELRSPIETKPAAPWTILRGAWEPKDGALTVTAEKGQPAALSVPFTQAAVEISYAVRLGKVERQTIRLDVGDGQSFRLDVSPGELAIVQNAANGQGQVGLAEHTVNLSPEQWHNVSIKVEGNKATLKVGDQAVTADHELIGRNKVALTFVVVDGTVAIKDVVIR